MFLASQIGLIGAIPCKWYCMTSASRFFHSRFLSQSDRKMQSDCLKSAQFKSDGSILQSWVWHACSKILQRLFFSQWHTLVMLLLALPITKSCLL